MKTITPENFSRINQSGVTVIDVRETDEFASAHLKGAIHVPLAAIEQGNYKQIPSEGEVYVICQSGRRSGRACDLLYAAGFTHVISLQGGVTACEKAGLPIVKTRRVLPIMRQVQIGAGSLVLISLGLSSVFGTAWLGLAAFVGVGQVFAGLSGFCGMARLLEKLPWNRLPSQVMGS